MNTNISTIILDKEYIYKLKAYNIEKLGDFAWLDQETIKNLEIPQMYIDKILELIHSIGHVCVFESTRKSVKKNNIKGHKEEDINLITAIEELEKKYKELEVESKRLELVIFRYERLIEISKQSRGDSSLEEQRLATAKRKYQNVIANKNEIEKSLKEL